MYPRSQILFPYSCVRLLHGLLDEQWDALVELAARQGESSPEGLAFSWMMIRLCSCENCDLGSYKASLGCDTCSQRVILGVKSTKLLLKRFEKAMKEIQQYLRDEDNRRPATYGRNDAICLPIEV